MKLLLYCTKAKLYLADFKGDYQTYSSGKELDELFDKGFNPNDIMNILNGKIVAECDYEIEEIKYVEYADEWGYETNTLNEDDLIEKSCLSGKQLFNYLKHCNEGGYAIHIKNLHIFDKPKELNKVYKIENIGGMLFTKPLTNAPQNMMKVSVNHWRYATYEPNDIKRLISIRPEELCKILNGEKTIEVRKRV